MSNGDKFLYLVTDEMAIQFYMFCPFVKNWVCSYMKSSLVITVKLSSLRMRNTEILKEISKPGEF
jgi:hypothetical protein